QNQVAGLDAWARRGIDFDLWWIDAGWYPCYTERQQRRYVMWGTWKPDPERFPNGLRPVAQRASGYGADLLVWFTPEGVRAGTQIHQEHPEWLRPIRHAEFVAKWVASQTSREDYILDLGNPEARQWITDHICKLIRDNGITVYRQDGGFDVASWWRANDPADRQGINENRYVQGYLQFWDDLLARNPGLWIDCCGSGGRRNDLESMRRSVPLHYTDFGYGDHPVKLSFQHVLFEWLPYFKEGSQSWDVTGRQERFDRRVDSFSYHCALSPMLMPCIDIRRDDYDYDLLRKMLGIWRQAAEIILNGDYYPLTPNHRSPQEWVARQFDCPADGRGFIQGIRLPACPDDTIAIRPRGFRSDVTYRLVNPETHDTRELTGADIQRDGFTLACPKREGAIWFYRAKTGR
ncbi:MAG: alpha-galactosidase, partial [Phycisphaerae bacterium]|nr:alpha-galactosidase [Phycisphaerae bacterium]